MECCFVCGGLGYCQTISVRKSPVDSQVPYFPFLERHQKPLSAQPISPEGTVRVCGLCQSYLVRQWYDNEARNISPVRRMYFMKRADGGVFNGAHPNAPADLMSHLNTVMGGAPSASVPCVESNALQHLPKSSASSSQPLSTPSKSFSDPALPSEHHIRCFLCRQPCLKWNAKTAYSTQVLENKEFFPFLECLEPPESAIPLTHGATKICVSCEAELARQWDYYTTAATPHDSRVYHVSIGNPPVFHSFTNTPARSPPAPRCALCPNSVTSAAYLSWLPKAPMYFPFLGEGHPFTEGSWVDRKRGDVLVCDPCHSHLSTQWARYETGRTPLHLRKYALLHSPHETKPPISNGESSVTKPQIAQCHVCLVALRDASTLKILRAKPTDSTTSSNAPYFPFLTKVRPATALTNTFPVCHHCYYNLIGQWRKQQRGGVEVTDRRYIHVELVCSNCSSLRAEKDAVKIIKDRIVCIECANNSERDAVSAATAPTAKPPSRTTSAPRTSLPPPAHTSSSGGRTTVIVPPMLHHQPHTSSATGHISIAGHHSGTSVSQSTAAIIPSPTFQEAAGLLERQQAADAANYANALRQLAQQVSSNSAPNEGPSAFLRAGDQPSVVGKKQPVAAVAPSQRTSNSEPVSHLSNQMQAYLSSLATASPQQSSPWLPHLSTPAQPSSMDVQQHQQALAAVAEMEHQMALYNSMYRASMLQQAQPSYYQNSRMGLPPYPGMPPHPGGVDPSDGMAMMAALQQRLAASGGGDSRAQQQQQQWGWNPEQLMMMHYMTQMAMMQQQQQAAYASQKLCSTIPTPSTPQSLPSSRPPTSTPSNLPNSFPTSEQRPYSHQSKHQSESNNNKATKVKDSTRGPPSAPLPPLKHTPHVGSGPPPVFPGSHQQSSFSSSSLPHYNDAASSNSNNKSGRSGLNLSSSTPPSLPKTSPISFSISGLMNNTSKPGDEKAKSHCAPTLNPHSHCAPTLHPQISEDCSLALDLSRTPTTPSRKKTASKLYRPFDTDEEDNERKPEVKKLKMTPSPLHSSPPPPHLLSSIDPGSIEEHFRRSLSSSSSTTARHCPPHLSPSPLHPHLSPLYRLSKLAASSSMSSLASEHFLLEASRWVLLPHHRHGNRTGVATRRKVAFLGSLNLLPSPSVVARRHKLRRRGEKRGARTKVMDKLRHLVKRLSRNDVRDDVDNKNIVTFVPVKGKREFESLHNLLKIFHQQISKSPISC